MYGWGRESPPAVPFSVRLPGDQNAHLLIVTGANSIGVYSAAVLYASATFCGWKPVKSTKKQIKTQVYDFLACWKKALGSQSRLSLISFEDSWRTWARGWRNQTWERENDIGYFLSPRGYVVSIEKHRDNLGLGHVFENLRESLPTSHALSDSGDRFCSAREDCWLSKNSLVAPGARINHTYFVCLLVCHRCCLHQASQLVLIFSVILFWILGAIMRRALQLPLTLEFFSPTVCMFSDHFSDLNWFPRCSLWSLPKMPKKLEMVDDLGSTPGATKSISFGTWYSFQNWKREAY